MARSARRILDLGLILTTSQASLRSFMSPYICRGVWLPTWCPCLSGADWCLQSDAVHACRYVASGLTNVTVQGARYFTYCYNHATTGAWTLVMRVSRHDGGINFYHNGEGWRRAEFKNGIISTYNFAQTASTAWGNNDCKLEVPSCAKRPFKDVNAIVGRASVPCPTLLHNLPAAEINNMFSTFASPRSRYPYVFTDVKFLSFFLMP